MPQRRQATRRFLATVLFTDIVGSTQRAAELGDHAWRDLLERHNAIVRRELKAFQGREMDTAGDGFFAVFEAPERAVRCAESIVLAVVLLGIDVRAGVHMGECEQIGGKVGGMAVTIGARIAALAEAGEVLVSGSVRDLMTGSDRHFEGGDLHELKGVADAWRVYRLLPGDVAGKVGSPRRSMVPLYTRRQRRRLVAGVAAVLVVALAVATGYVLTRSAAEVVVGENAVGVIGAGADAQVRAAVRVGHRPTAVAAGFGSVWVTNSRDNSISRIDMSTKTAGAISVGESPVGIAVGAGSVWVANSTEATVSRIDPLTSRPTTIPVRPGPTGIVVAFGSVWVTNSLDASVIRIDPATNKTHVVSVGASPNGIAAGAGYVWVTNQGDGTVTRIDPHTYVTDSTKTVGSGPAGIAVGGGAAWVANNLDGSLSRIDVEDLSVTSRTLAKGGGAYGVAVHGRDVWVSNEYAGTLMKVNPRDFRLARTVKLHGAPLGLAFVGNELWFTNAEGGSAVHRGGVLTMVGPALEYDTDPAVLDPLLQYIDVYPRLAILTNDGLMGFRRAGGVQGAAIVPDLAITQPQISDEGRTYTFHLRPGVRYSTGAPVLAGDIRRGIERVVVHPDTAPEYYAAAIVGGRACWDAAKKTLRLHKPRPPCDLRAGINADDRTGTITFHLTQPTPEFPYQLAMANASAVPQDTPVDLRPGTFLPATGPYMVSSYTPKQDGAGGHGRLELVRNPHFHVWSPAAQPAGYPDRIVFEDGYTEKQAVSRVSDGRADMLWLGAPQSAVDRLRTRYGSQLHTSAASFVYYVFLDATKPPFNDVNARRAVAYALDRAALLNGSNGLTTRVTCQLLPPEFSAYRPYCPFTVGGAAAGQWNGPDRELARDLVKKSGTYGDKVVVVSGSTRKSRAVTKAIVKVLVHLGYVASVDVRGPTSDDVPYEQDPRRKRWNVGTTGWGADYPAPSTFLATLASCIPGTGTYNNSHYCDRTLDEQIRAAIGQQSTDPGRATDAWAAIDRKVVDAAAIIPVGVDVRQDFVSRRVGNTAFHIISGSLIGQMWVR